MYHIQNNIKRLRKERKIYQYELAGAIGVSPKTMANWEYGRKNPNLLHVLLIADALGCTLDDLGFKVVDEDDDC